MTTHDDGPVSRVRTVLLESGIGDTVRSFPAGVPTAVAAAEALDCDVAAITNSLIFDLNGAPLLILASGAARVDTALVADRLGEGRIRRASPDFVLEHTGQKVGGVAPVGHPHRIRTLLDVSLRSHNLLWAGAGDHESMFCITYQDLHRITGAEETAVR
ncbi:YbaK/prolyl-tRNA synthetase associated region [Pseudarthrobacter chlorophenolicus A6]|uniref:YbaK/prolyl-tRNA synthetase associated region n=1 Tax=Pseudarthrobacter chlorophenolicus (strain ATCC 700700 / DSM 12829 / CIP 107037 / JCM 12360 / KCTC 9906 / NCIMB 13794 / A6) TaxID=452863 RepID=B8H7R3_PSECP|nr:YbaK/EbsC family protein [Pseudarthrobacter chlorophenolicus]ACL39843.1 YbaK/prolyl-tRNA synthetase associated region [Pseudarthrobacter chlorophenolicus A6]SDQ92722.1 Cys-tRNA(Pro) deacylase, prolyl-tRNA editing enzyme YbaK/EbsC [Pseudarthrobacter chlorophenolicus]